MIMKLIRRLTQCSRGIHWRMKYDSGLPNDIRSPGTCSDCSYRSEGVKCKPRSKVEEAWRLSQ